TFPCIMQPFLWVTSLSETLMQTVAEKGLCAVISCTFTHPDNIKPTAAIWFKCPASDRCDKVKNIIFHSETPSKAQKAYKQRVSLLETDLTKKNCSVIINDIRENDAGEYQFRLPSSYTYPKKVTLTQKPSVLTPALTEGEPATLTCTAPGICSGTPPNITWTWRGTGDNITEEDLTTVTTTHFSTLTFTPSAKHHGTNVTCLVTFNGRITTKKTLTMNVAYVKEPKISGCNTVREGDTLNLTCSDDSCPPSSSNITWSKKGTTALERNNSGRAILIISNMTREHAGEYVCTAQHHSRSLTQRCSDRLKMACDMLLPLNCLWFISPLMTCVCVCVTQGVPLPFIRWLTLKEYSFTTSVLMFSVNSTISLPVRNHTNTTMECVSRNEAGQAVGGKQTPLQVELREGEENGGPQTSGAVGKSTTGGEPNEVDYASINYSLLKKKTPEEAEKKTTTTETDYAEIKRQKKNEEEEDGGEGSGVMEEVEWEEGDEMVGKEEEKENGKPLRETDEDTALYSNIKAIMGGE
uniref:B-cell receptor CD22 n=1 Tax=Oncorhynchus kisutch TaxID=8019 RepID=A0A8C7JMD9_ONCKI